MDSSIKISHKYISRDFSVSEKSNKASSSGGLSLENRLVVTPDLEETSGKKIAEEAADLSDDLELNIRPLSDYTIENEKEELDISNDGEISKPKPGDAEKKSNLAKAYPYLAEYIDKFFTDKSCVNFEQAYVALIDEFSVPVQLVEYSGSSHKPTLNFNENISEKIIDSIVSLQFSEYEQINFEADPDKYGNEDFQNIVLNFLNVINEINHLRLEMASGKSKRPEIINKIQNILKEHQDVFDQIGKQATLMGELMNMSGTTTAGSQLAFYLIAELQNQKEFLVAQIENFSPAKTPLYMYRSDTSQVVPKVNLSFEKRIEAVVEARNKVKKEGATLGKIYSSLVNGSEDQKKDNRAFRNNLYNRVAEVYGKEYADHAVSLTGMTYQEWQLNSKAMSDNQVKSFIKNVEKKLESNNLIALNNFIQNSGKGSFSSVIGQRMTILSNIHHGTLSNWIEARVLTMSKVEGALLRERCEKMSYLSKEEVQKNLKTFSSMNTNSPEILKLVENRVKECLSNSKIILTPEVLEEFALQACTEYVEGKKGAFTKAYPFLAEYAGSEYSDITYLSFDAANLALIKALQPVQLQSSKPIMNGGNQLKTDNKEFRRDAYDLLDELQGLVDLHNEVMANQNGGGKEKKILENKIQSYLIQHQNLFEKAKQASYMKELTTKADTNAGKLLARCLLDEILNQRLFLENQLYLIKQNK